jgi:hypothetical protein
MIPLSFTNFLYCQIEPDNKTVFMLFTYIPESSADLYIAILKHDFSLDYCLLYLPSCMKGYCYRITFMMLTVF